MQITALFSIAALAGSAIAAGAEAPIAARDCVNGGFYYGEAGCKPNCQGGKCSIQPGHENDNDYICVCSDTSKPGCGGMFKGKPACSSKCNSGDCTQLLLPYTCKC